MIPRTFPSILGALGETKMVVYVLPSVSGLQAWKDYIPVKGITTENTAVQNTYANDGYQVMSPLEDISTKQAWKDYIPVFEDASYTKAWSTDAGGYIPASGLFSVYSLFANNEQGVWYDPSDLTTLFQDAAGTTPVTAVEQPVGLILDKSKNGVGTNGAKRVNLLNYSEQFDNAAWTKFDATITANTVVAPDGTLTGDKIVEGTTNNFHLVSQTIASSSTSAFTFTIYAKAAERGWARVVIDFATGGFVRAWFNLSTGVIGTSEQSGSATLSGTSITSVGNGWYRLSISGSSQGGTNRAATIVCQRVDAEGTYSGDGTSGVYIWGADLRLASESNTLPTYQKITDTWYNTLLGNHAYQTTSANRPTLSARYNLLTKTEQFDDAAWTKLNTTVTANAVIAPDGTTTADKIVETATSNIHTVGQSYTTIAAQYTVSVYAKAAERNWIALAGPWANSGAWFDLINGVVGTKQAGVTSASILSVGEGWYKCSLTGTATASTGSYAVYVANANNSVSYLGDTSKGIYIWGADLRVANDGVGIPAYQRVNTATDYDTVGFPKYLSFNGSSSSMVTNTITPGTDKAQVFAGARKLSDTAIGAVVEVGNIGSVNNGVSLLAPQANATGNYRFGSGGSSFASAIGATYAAPITNVISGIGNISGDQAILRVNSTQAASLTADQGTGNYGNYPLYIGARAGTSLWFNGRIYSMIVRFGSTLTTAQITNTENYINTKTKAY